MAPAVLDPRAPVVSLLERFGPGSALEPVAESEALAYVRGLATAHYENFSVLSSLVPPGLRDDFAAVYAFCRWADDLGDETGRDEAARARSLALLGWWRRELAACFQGRPSHPVFVALAVTVRRHALPEKPFADLISAFEQDQTVTAYQTWAQVLDYCTRSADPVGRLVLMLAGYRPEEDSAGRFAMSDAICTGLQLVNFWQDVRRDLVERDRVYIPAADTGVTPAMLRDWLDRGDDPAARVPYIRAVRPLVERTREHMDRGRGLPATLDPSIRPVVWLFDAGGRSVLSAVERIGCVTLWQRPRLTRLRKATLLARAWLMAKSGGGRA